MKKGPALKRLPASFFRTVSGNEPVRKWLKEKLSDDDRKIVGQNISDAEYGWPVGMPLCRKLTQGLYEVRCDISSKRIARVIFYPADKEMILLHGFIKKSQKTPRIDIDLADTRKKEYLRNAKKT